MSDWNIEQSRELFNITKWSCGYFDLDESGNVIVCPSGEASGPSFDLRRMIDEILRRGVETPVLLRFDGILRSRLRELQGAFRNAIEEFGYGSRYCCVFPIKVNQQRHLVDVLASAGGPDDLGIEVGSKPELLAVMALYSEKGRLIICNGYKDREYVELALLTRRLGARPVIVIEKASELDTILKAADYLKIDPILGVRTKLGGAGAGRWKDSGGDRSKFGLTTRQIVCLVDDLRERGKLDCLRLLHFHLGSQITQIRSIKKALDEATRTLIGLREMGAPIEWFDVGGGLGIDYDGSSTDFDSSMNYSLQEYANDVVFHLKTACQEAEIPEPIILSESGRALTAHHAVLVTEVLGVTDYSSVGTPEPAAADEPETIRQLASVAEIVSEDNFQECYHDAMELREAAMTLFNVGQLSLTERARVEEFYWQACEKILKITRTQDYVPDDLGHLERDMADIYFLNFSVFQSMPDSWAINQLFPILPIHRHDEEPTRRAVLADITCDSDGKIDRFIDLRDVKPTLELHTMKRDEPYYVGLFLIGAYQEILGDLHNLFGDTHVVHVDQNDGEKPRITHLIPGDKVQEVLSYVEYFPSDLQERLRLKIERAIDEDRLGLEDSAALRRRFEVGLASYTYLVRPDLTPPA